MKEYVKKGFGMAVGVYLAVAVNAFVNGVIAGIKSDAGNQG